jgi:ABC-type branched-subunit amino acid transport system substrate-binding protein
MPRYSMGDNQLTDLVSYLERLGDEDDNDPGVSSTTIRIGAALPLSGPQAEAGRSIRETLELFFATASRNGGIYGRNVELVVEDSHGDSAGLVAATQRLISEDQVFALIANLQPAGSLEISRLLETSEVPLIGPVTLSPREQGLPNPYVFYLLPSLYDQARAVVDFIAAREAPRHPRLALIHGETDLDHDVIEGLRSEAAAQGLEVTAEASDVPSAINAILSTKPDYLVFSGDGSGLARVGRELENTNAAPVLVSFISTAQSGVSLLPQHVAERALFAAPAAPPDLRQAKEFFSLLQAAHLPRTYLGLRTASFAAGNVLLQSLRSCGSRPSRDSLVQSLEHLQHFQTEVIAPISFGPNQRVGTKGAVMLAMDSNGKDFVVVSDWITPKF